MKIGNWVVLSVLSVVIVGAGIGVGYYNEPPPGQGGVTGRFWYQDDTGMPDHLATDGTFLVIPAVRVPDLWPEMAEGLAGPWFPDASGDFDFDELDEQYGATKVEVQSNGRFRVVSPPGPTVICLVGLSGVNGCSEVELPERGSLRAGYGEGGFGIRVK